MTDIIRVLEEQAQGQVLTDSPYRFLTGLLTDAMPQMVWATNADGEHIFYNQRWYEYTGLTPEQSHGFGFADALHPDDVERTLARWREAWEAGSNYEIEYRFLRHDGAARWFVGRAMPVRDPASGEVVMWVGTCTDIHEQKETQARLEAALRREAIQNRIGEALRLTTDPDAVLGTACRELAEALDCSRTYYADIDVERNTATITHDCCRNVESWAGVYPLDGFGPAVIEELKHGRTAVIRDTRTDSRTAAHYPTTYEPTGIRAYVAVPILRDGKWVSALAVNHTAGPRDWADAEVALLETVAGQTDAVAMLARFYAREHRTAQAFQETVSPAPEARLGCYRFASHYAAALEESAIGGDFYDQFRLSDGRVGVVVGDVSGKGLAAAVQTALVKFTLRGFALESPSPGETLTRLNRSLLAQGGLTGFVTLCYAVLNPATQTFQYASAGHEPPILCAPSGETLELMPTGPIMGVADDFLYEERTLPLPAGSRLLLYTDGLSEARGEEGFLGLERIKESLCDEQHVTDPVQVVRRLLEQMTAFTGGGLRDDVALLLVIAEDPAKAPPFRSFSGPKMKL